MLLIIRIDEWNKIFELKFDNLLILLCEENFVNFWNLFI